MLAKYRLKCAPTKGARACRALDNFQFLRSSKPDWLVRSRFSCARALNFSFRLLERSHIRGFHPPHHECKAFNCYPCTRNREFSALRLFHRAADAEAPADRKRTRSRMLTSASWILFDYRISFNSFPISLYGCIHRHVFSSSFMRKFRVTAWQLMRDPKCFRGFAP